MKIFGELLASLAKINSIAAVADGCIIPVEQLPDETFSKQMLGPSVAIELSGDRIVAPAAGVITMIFPTLHAFAITLKNNIEVLVHIGINTVELKGMGFKKCVNVGDSVNKGDTIILLDRKQIAQKGYDTSTVMIFTELAGHTISISAMGEVVKGRSTVATY